MSPSKFFLIFILIVIVTPTRLLPQSSTTGKNVAALTRYISTSESFMTPHKVSEIDLVDSIYLNAIRMTGGEISPALAACIWTCLTVRSATIISPILRTPFVIPFFSASDSIFREKNRRLPKYLFPDSPNSPAGDVDKLAHFFGSAYIEFNSFIPGVTEFFGWFIEVFEETFKLDSKISYRDIKVNSLGIKFGNGLRKKNDLLPSDFLKLYNSTNK